MLLLNLLSGTDCAHDCLFKMSVQAEADKADKTDFTTLKFMRGQIKAQMTRFKTFIGSLESHENVDMIEVETRLNAALPCLSKFDELQDKIELLLGDEEQPERMSFENSYYKAISGAKRLLRFQNNVQAAPPKQEFISGIQERVKLPKLNLPEFAGHYNQ